MPVTKFVITLPGGKHGLLVASTNLCAKPVKAIIQLKGQNGKKANKRPKSAHPVRQESKRGKRKHHGNSRPAMSSLTICSIRT